MTRRANLTEQAFLLKSERIMRRLGSKRRWYVVTFTLGRGKPFWWNVEQGVWYWTAAPNGTAFLYKKHATAVARTLKEAIVVARPTSQTYSAAQRLVAIKEAIEAVDQRAMAADGDVTPTLQEMTQAEMSKIYELARGTP